MAAAGPIDALAGLAREFGPSAARRRHALLTRIAAAPRLRAGEVRRLAPLIEFIRAYPDGPAVVDAARACADRIPGTDVVHEYAYGVARRLVAIDPESIDIDWEGFEDESALLECLDLIVHPSESDGLVDRRTALSEWFARARPAGSTDLRFLVDMLESTGLPDPVRAHLFDACAIPLRYRGPRPGTLRLEGPMVYQRAPLRRDPFPLPPFIRRKVSPARRGRSRHLAFALRALSARQLEIYPLIHATPDDIAIVEGERGVRTLMIGVGPPWRSPLETLFFFLVLKNGVPVAYGPAAVFGGCCEMGINLFPEFRGGEIRLLYANLMRVLHHRLGVEYFFLTRYGMGEDNPEAIRTGAFWFYRKLGFRPTNPNVEALARAEEARRAADPAHRSDRRMLRRLSRTEAYLDLSSGRVRPVDLARLSTAASRRVLSAAGADRSAAARRCAARIGRLVGSGAGSTPAGARALAAAAPILSLIADLKAWPRRDRAALGRFLRAKDAPSESLAARLSARMPRLLEALHRCAASGADG